MLGRSEPVDAPCRRLPGAPFSLRTVRERCPSYGSSSCQWLQEPAVIALGDYGGWLTACWLSSASSGLASCLPGAGHLLLKHDRSFDAADEPVD